MSHKPNEEEVRDVFRNAYSFVIKGEQLIIYFKNGNNKNLLILEKL